MAYYIYKHTSPNGLVYIGKTTSDPKIRWGKEGNGYQTAPRFYAAILLHKWDNFTHEVIEEVEEDAAVLAEREHYWIKHYAAHIVGYNSQYGGKGRDVPIAVGYFGRKPYDYDGKHRYTKEEKREQEIEYLVKRFKTGDEYDKALLFEAIKHIEKQCRESYNKDRLKEFYQKYRNKDFEWISLFELLKPYILRSDGIIFSTLESAAIAMNVRERRMEEAINNNIEIKGYTFSRVI